MVRMLLCLWLLCPVLVPAQETPWQPLFNGTDLSQWVQRGGSATYRVADGTITGTSVRDRQNSFLCTRTEYGDFILEMEVRLDHGINSGVQMRSESRSDYLDGRVHGYQVELDPSVQRRWAGGIYDEGRRGWLYPLTRNPQGQQAFVVGDWNHLRIEAIGPHIRTWINGVPCARLVDRLTAKGFIALQVHGIGPQESPGKQIQWRDLRILTDNPEAYRWPTTPQTVEISHLPNALTAQEERTGWRLLWDGQRSPAWIASGGGDVRVDGGTLRLNDVDSLVWPATLHDFELRFDVRFSEATQGAFLAYGTSAGAELRYVLHAGTEAPGSLSGLIPAENLSDPTSKALRYSAKDGWNRVRIVVRDGQVTHWLNQMKVVEYRRDTQLFRALVAAQEEGVASAKKAAAGARLSFYTRGEVALRSLLLREF